MYKLDSGLISLIATIAAIGIGVYSAINDKKKAQARKRLLEQERMPDGEESVSESYPGRVQEEASGQVETQVKMFNNPFEELLKAFKVEETEPAGHRTKGDVDSVAEDEEDDLFSFASKKPEPEVRISYQPVMQDFIPEKQRPAIQPQIVADECVYDNGLESIENSGVSLMDGLSTKSGMGAFEMGENGSEVGEDSLRERIKRSPKDVVLFAEVLRPKYQEF